MTDDNKHKTCCEQCGQEVPEAELIVDQETGMQLCTECSLERESCGCSDGDEEEGRDSSSLPGE